MSARDDYFGQNDSLAGFDLETLGSMMGNGEDEFAGVDFASFSLPDLPQFDVNQPSEDSRTDLDVGGENSDLVETIVDPLLRDTSGQLEIIDPSKLNFSQFDMNLLSTAENPTILDVPGDSPSLVGSATDLMLTGPSTQLGNVSQSMVDTLTTPLAFPVDTTLAPLTKSAGIQAGYAFDIYGLDDQLAAPAQNLEPTVPSISLHPYPPASETIIKKYDRQLTKQKQDKTTPCQPSKRRPTIPEGFIPYIDVENPPRRESEVHDAKGCKDTTLANDYYYSIKSLPPWENFFGKGRDIVYQGPEFHRNVEFTGTEFMRYLRTSDRTPVLIIQLQPQKCNHRYIRGGQSFKCRNKDCPDPKKTIWKGHFRVCITEFYDSEGHWVNPFQSAAGYLHLYCLENMLNLSEVVADVPVSVCPEVRNFKHEPSNPMELSKLEQRTYEKWVDEFAPKWKKYRDQHTGTRIPRDRWPSLATAEEDRLYYRLTEAHLKKNPSTVKMAQKRRAKAGGKRISAHVDQFLGDVGKHVAVMKRRRNAHVAGMDDEKSPNGAEPCPESFHKRRRLSSHQYDLRSATPRRKGQQPAPQPKTNHGSLVQRNTNSSRIHPLPSQAQLPPRTVPAGFEQPAEFNVDDFNFFDLDHIPTMGWEAAYLDAFLGTGDADSSPPSLSEVPGDSIVEQSIVIKTNTVSVPVLTSPPRTRRDVSAQKSPGARGMGVKKRKRSSTSSSRRSPKRLSPPGSGSLSAFLESLETIVEE